MEVIYKCVCKDYASCGSFVFRSTIIRIISSARDELTPISGMIPLIFLGMIADIATLFGILTLLIRVIIFLGHHMFDQYHSAKCPDALPFEAFPVQRP